MKARDLLKKRISQKIKSICPFTKMTYSYSSFIQVKESIFKKISSRLLIANQVKSFTSFDYSKITTFKPYSQTTDLNKQFNEFCSLIEKKQFKEACEAFKKIQENENKISLNDINKIFSLLFNQIDSFTLVNLVHDYILDRKIKMNGLTLNYLISIYLNTKGFNSAYNLIVEGALLGIQIHLSSLMIVYKNLSKVPHVKTRKKCSYFIFNYIGRNFGKEFKEKLLLASIAEEKKKKIEKAKEIATLAAQVKKEETDKTKEPEKEIKAIKKEKKLKRIRRIKEIRRLEKNESKKSKNLTIKNKNKTANNENTTKLNITSNYGRRNKYFKAKGKIDRKKKEIPTEMNKSTEIKDKKDIVDKNNQNNKKEE